LKTRALAAAAFGSHKETTQPLPSNFAKTTNHY
jgi:hypothetical protein